ncbi:MAG: hypothetical protein V1875_04305 [Candidatus Altiarchaeota archaeon]
MKLTNYIWIGVGVILVFVLGAFAFNVRGLISQTNQGEPELIGGDLDAHGCLIAAGYSWNESQGKCMRSWSGELQGIASASISEAEARTIAEKSCIKGGEALGEGMYNENSRTWWFDANLNFAKEGCNPACVVSEETRTAEINWRCTGLITPKCACPQGYRKDGDACNPECYYSTPPCLAPSIPCADTGEKPIPVEQDGGIGSEKPIPVESDGGIGTSNTREYISRNLTQCAATDWICEDGKQQFYDENGCGCEQVHPRPPEGKLRAFECSLEQRKADFCTEEYAPVCGFSDPAKIQCIKYPCAQTYGNACAACRDENVAYYTIGECQAEGNELR